MEEIRNWHGLPCLDIPERNKSAIFTNINGTLTICQLDSDILECGDTLEEFSRNGGFDCLKESFKHSSREFAIVLSITERCNAHCSYCFLDAQTSGGDMDPQLIDSAIELGIKFSKERILNIAAFGGEPTLRPDLVAKMVEVANNKFLEYNLDKNRLRFSITTNGYFDDSFCDFLIAHQFCVNLSMDGIPYVQKKQRPCHIQFEQLEKNIKRLAASQCSLKIRCTVTEFSAQYMLESTRYLQSLGVKRVHFEPVTPGGRATVKSPTTNQPNAQIFVDELFKCISYGEINGIDVVCFPYMNINNSPAIFCDGSIQNRIVVGAHGILSTCVEVLDREHPLFDYLGVGHYDFENRKFVIDFNNRRICRECQNNNKQHECHSCPLNFFCAGGCPTRNYRGTMNTDSISEFRCQIMKMVIPKILLRLYNKTFPH